MATSELMGSIAVQQRVVYALLLREVITRYGRHGLGVLWLILEPMMFTVGVAALWYAVGGHDHSNIPIAAFAVTGYSSVLLWRNVSSRCLKAITPNATLLHHRNVRYIDIYLSRILLEWIGATASFAVLTIAFSVVGLIQWPQDLGLVLSGWLMLAWFSLGLGLIVGCLSEFSEAFERSWHIITYLAFPLSGAAFMVDWFAPQVQEKLLWIPMVHGMEMIRHGFFGDVIRTHEQPSYFAVANLVGLAIGLVLLSKLNKRTVS